MGTSQSVTLLLRYKTVEVPCERVDSIRDLETAALMKLQKQFTSPQTSLKFLYEPLLFPIESDADLKVVYEVAEKNGLRELPISVSKRLFRSRSTSPSHQPKFPLVKIRDTSSGRLLGGGLILPSLSLCCTSRSVVTCYDDLDRITVKLHKAMLSPTHEQFLLSSNLNVVCFSYQSQGRIPEFSLDISLQATPSLSEGDFCTAVQPAGSRYQRLEVVTWSPETVIVSSSGLTLGSLVYDLNWRLLGLVTGPITLALAPALHKLVYRTGL